VWQRWLREYLPRIGSWHKWFSQEENLNEDDKVENIDPNPARKD